MAYKITYLSQTISSPAPRFIIYDGTSVEQYGGPAIATITEGTLTTELNKAGSAVFVLPPTHPYCSIIKTMLGEIEIRDESGIVFSGRPYEITYDFNNFVRISCEGNLARLNDTLVRAFDYTAPASNAGAVANYLSMILNKVNALQQYGRPAFVLGTCTVNGRADLLQGVKNPTRALEIIEHNLLDIYGGYLRMHEYDAQNNRYVLDYLSDLPYGTATQAVNFGSNLLDIETTFSGKDIITGVVPIGAEVGEGNEKKRVDLSTIEDGTRFWGGSTVNISKGGDSITATPADITWGTIEEEVTFNDALTAEALAMRATRYLLARLNAASAGKTTVRALDLSRAGGSGSPFRAGQRVRVQSDAHEDIHKYPATLVLRAITVDLLDPASSDVTLETETERTGG